MNKDGSRKEDWLNWNGKWYYLQPGSGRMRISWIQVNNKQYYMNKDGAMQEGWFKSINDKRYYFKPGQGHMLTGWILWDKDGRWYYTDTSGAMKTGWLFVAGKTYYLNKDGARFTDWLLYNKKWYFFDRKNGQMLVGQFATIDSQEYYFDSKGVMSESKTLGSPAYMKKFKIYMDELISYNSKSAPDKKWKLFPVEDSLYHMYGNRGGYNLKFVSYDGIYEAVYGENGVLLTEYNDPVNMGTYNYSPHEIDELHYANHGNFDVLPYLSWNNAPNDPGASEDYAKNADKYYQDPAAITYRDDQIKRLNN